MALTAVIPTSTKMAASKANTINGALLSIDDGDSNSVTRFNALIHQRIAADRLSDEVKETSHKLTQISCTSCTGTG